ncbi:hypothetical protein SB717_37180, partial [Priestia sp. SIMBA_032]|uniref:hypothetical protein n=1 Tax=Priestia sp. SIMBA_032 TaxID=3085775 RepID=UPI0039781A42
PLVSEGSSEPKLHWLLARALDRAGRHDAAGEHLAHSGWFVPPIMRRRDREMPEALYQALESLDTEGWDTQAPDDERPRPVFVLGWP